MSLEAVKPKFFWASTASYEPGIVTHLKKAFTASYNFEPVAHSNDQEMAAYYEPHI